MELVIPEGTMIYGYSFKYNKIKNVSFPGTMTEIPKSAFCYNELTGIYLHDGIRKIGDAAFSGNKLTEIRIGKLVDFGSKPFGDDSPGKNFVKYYRDHGCAAGIYRNSPRWSFEAEKMK